MDAKVLIVMSQKEKLTEVLNWIRIVFFILIIFIHNSNYLVEGKGIILGKGTNVPFFYYISEYISEVVARIAVPGFFIISGYLFFYKVEFNRRTYIEKIKRRFKSLFIPYLFWCILFAVYYFVLPLVIPALFQEKHEITLSNFIRVLWCTNDGHAMSQLWFIRDLMICVLTAPIYYCLLKGKARYPFLILAFVVWFIGYKIPIIGYLGFSSEAILFWSIGSFLAIHRKDLLLELPYSWLFMTAFSLSIVDLITKDMATNPYIHHAFIMVGLVFLFFFFSTEYDRIKKKTVEGESSYLPHLSLFMLSTCRG